MIHGHGVDQFDITAHRSDRLLSKLFVIEGIDAARDDQRLTSLLHMKLTQHENRAAVQRGLGPLQFRCT